MLHRQFHAEGAPIRMEPLIPFGILPWTNAPALKTSRHSPTGGDNQLKTIHGLCRISSGAAAARRNCRRLQTPELFKTNLHSSFYGSLFHSYYHRTRSRLAATSSTVLTSIGRAVVTRIGWLTRGDCKHATWGTTTLTRAHIPLQLPALSPARTLRPRFSAAAIASVLTNQPSRMFCGF